MAETCDYCEHGEHVGRRCRAHVPVLIGGQYPIPPLRPADSYKECGCMITLFGKAVTDL